MADVTLQAVITAKDEASSKMEKLAGTMKKFSVIAIGAGVAAAGVFAKKSIDAAKESEKVIARLTQIVKTSTGASDEQIDALVQQAEALEKVGVVSAETTIAAQGQLASFDLQAGTIKKLIPSMLNYIVAEKGINASTEDGKQLVNSLAQALNGNFTSLTKTGFVLDDATKKLISNGTESERAAALVKVLDSTYSGLNEEMRRTTEGGIFGMKSAMEDLQKTIGKLLLPAVNLISGGVATLAGKLNDFVQSDTFKSWLQSVKDFIHDKFIPAFQAIWEFIVTVLVPMFKDTLMPIWKEVYDTLSPYIPTLKEIAKYFAIIVGGTIVGGILILSTAVLGLVKVFDAVLKSIKAVFDWIEKVVNKMADFTAIGKNFSNPFSKIGDAVGNLFGGGKAGGGYVQGGTPYMVGERGPELFVPGRSGSIVPNGKTGGGIVLNISGNSFGGRGDIDYLIGEVKRVLNREQVLAQLRV